ncbi:hypothetical protein ALC57_17637 [Trachymyrmex cornetzi]|uniref:Uncharacterized protein n=1 Tax=Trachymyrmex cornetzi TaxID=471704 RepID=A0A151ITE4_9HYME|nr:hypothetical protein ALC57_17637 [Trachymyrmex cornetzi]
MQTKLELADDAESNDHGSFEEAFYTLAAKIRELTISSPPGRRSDEDSVSRSSSRGAPEPASYVRLPKLSLPSFSSKYDEWFPFRDIFNSVIHSNATLSNAQKLQYLKSSVTGEASSVISSLEISDANYDVAWSRLKERYDNERVVIQNHIRAIMDLCLSFRANGGAILTRLDNQFVKRDFYVNDLLSVESSRFGSTSGAAEAPNIYSNCNIMVYLLSNQYSYEWFHSFLVKNLSDLLMWPITEIKNKAVQLPYEDSNSWCCMPLLHSSSN